MGTMPDLFDHALQEGMQPEAPLAAHNKISYYNEPLFIRRLNCQKGYREALYLNSF